MDTLAEIQQLLTKMNACHSGYCYVAFYNDGSGFVNEELEDRDAFLLDFKSPEDAIAQIKEYLAG